MTAEQPLRKRADPPAERAANAATQTNRHQIANLPPPAMVKQRLGAVVLAAVIVAVIAASAWPGGDTPGSTPRPDQLVVKGYGGGLKANFLHDPEVQAILADRYGLQVDITSIGSIDLACGRQFGPEDDFVWLGDSVALARYQDRGCTMLRAESVYNSPVVLYSWTPIVDALVAAGVARVTAGGAYTVDFRRLVELMMAGQSWSTLGLPQLHGRILVRTTDPARSNSGFLFAGLLANTLNDGNVVDTTTVDPLLPAIESYFLQLGYMEPRSSDLFTQFLITGMGAKPIVVLYESLIPEVLASHPEYEEQIRQDVRILYPEPTLWASHPFIARTANGAKLLDALKDRDIQRLAWERHGQRPGVVGVPIDPSAIPIPGILEQITSVTNMPALDAMDEVLATISSPNEPTPTPAPTKLAANTTESAIGRRYARYVRRRSQGRRALVPFGAAYCRQNVSTAPRSASTLRRSSSAV
jgi:hypothetical protein